MILIDFFGGSYGHFLEHVLNRYVFKLPSANFNPINELGASHNSTPEYLSERKVISGHYSFPPESNYLTKPTTDDTVIQIHIDLESLYPIYYNGITRAGNSSLDIDNPEKDTLKKLDALIEQLGSKYGKYTLIKETLIKEFGEREDYPRSVLRNHFYANFNEPDLFFKPFLNYDVKEKIIFPVKSLNSFESFIIELDNLSVKLTQQPFKYDQSFTDLHKNFIEKNQGLTSLNKCNKIIDNIISGQDIDIDVNILEEAYINAHITKMYDIHDGIECFSDNYPTNTKIIYDQIIDFNKKN